MNASLLGLPAELREQIIGQVVYNRGTMELQYPIWADKSVFVPPIFQVCKPLREDAIQAFYRVNVFTWVMEPEGVRILPPSEEKSDRADPTKYPLDPASTTTKEYGPSGPLVSSLPWQYPFMASNLRRLRLNLFLPPQHQISLWTDRFAKQLVRFVSCTEQGHKLKDFKLLIGTWHSLRDLGEPQQNVLGILENLELRGLVQVRTRSLDQQGKTVVQMLDLERRMRAAGHCAGYIKFQDLSKPSQYLDWEWEGGAVI
ncbi:hypothetical protein Q7P37_001814 [Cladosporium fusiforme]